MEEKKVLKVSFGDINDKNINILRKLNYDIIPVKYGTSLYMTIMMEYTQFSKLVFYNDIAIGAYTVRLQNFKGNLCAYILTIGTLQPYRKYGVGKQMMKHLQQQLREKSEAHAIYLHMHVLNTVGKQFYEACGFYIEDKLQNYYTDLQQPHCYILMKKLRE